MRQLSLIDGTLQMAGVMAAIRAAMRHAAGAPESEGRKMLVERINELAQSAGVRLTSGNAASISKATLDKWLSPSFPRLVLIIFNRSTMSLTSSGLSARFKFSPPNLNRKLNTCHPITC